MWVRDALHLAAMTRHGTLATASVPQLIQPVSSFVSLGILLLSPANFPAEQLPAALQAVHRVLPVA